MRRFIFALAFLIPACGAPEAPPRVPAPKPVLLTPCTKGIDCGAQKRIGPRFPEMPNDGGPANEERGDWAVTVYALPVKGVVTSFTVGFASAGTFCRYGDAVVRATIVPRGAEVPSPKKDGWTATYQVSGAKAPAGERWDWVQKTSLPGNLGDRFAVAVQMNGVGDRHIMCLATWRTNAAKGPNYWFHDQEECRRPGKPATPCGMVPALISPNPESAPKDFWQVTATMEPES